MRMEQELMDSYKAAEAVARSRSNFYYSFVVLPAEKRRAFCAVYAFMRYCDDISDGNSRHDSKQAMLRDWRQQLDAALAGKAPGHGILPAFRDAVDRFSIPAQYFHWIIDGAEMDLDGVRYNTFEDLYRYCFNVASAVGLVCLQIFGYSDDKAKQYAEQCGIAFQLTNILRDLKEDADRGRIYLPAEDLKKFEYTEEDLHRGTVDQRFRRLMKYEEERARDYYAAARKLLPLIEVSSRPALWAMITIYERILDRIARRQYDVFRSPVRLAHMEKLSIALKAIGMRFFGRPGLGPAQL
jgi:phytoene synthase